MKQMATTKTRSHNPIPYAKIAKMFGLGDSYEKIAKAVNRYNAKAEDPTKTIRAIVSRMLTAGFPGENGKLIKLKARPGQRAIGSNKGAKKAAPKARKRTAVKARGRKTASPRKRSANKGPAVLVLAIEGQNVLITAPRRESVTPLKSFLPMVQNELQKAGYAVVKMAGEEPVTDLPLGDVNDAEVEATVSENTGAEAKNAA
jgi:hypothetical protein